MGTVESKSVADVGKSTESMLASLSNGRRFSLLQQVPSYTSKSDYSDPASSSSASSDAMGNGRGGSASDGRVTSFTSSLLPASSALEKSFILMKQLRHPNIFHYLRHTPWNGRQCSVTGLPVCDLLYTSSRTGGVELAPSAAFTSQTVSEAIFGLVGITSAVKVLTTANLHIRRLHWSHFAITAVRTPPVISSTAVHHGRWVVADLTQVAHAQQLQCPDPLVASVTNGAALALCLLEIIGLLLDSPLHRVQVVALVRRVCAMTLRVPHPTTGASTSAHERGDGGAGVADQGSSASSLELEISDVTATFDALLAALRVLKVQTADFVSGASSVAAASSPVRDDGDEDPHLRQVQGAIEGTTPPPPDPPTPHRTPTPLGSTLRRADSSFACDANSAPVNPILALIDWIYATIAAAVAVPTDAPHDRHQHGAAHLDVLVSILVDGLRDPLTVCLTQGAQLHMCYSSDVFEMNKKTAGAGHVANDSFVPSSRQEQVDREKQSDHEEHQDPVASTNLGDYSPRIDVRSHGATVTVDGAAGASSSQLAAAYAIILEAVMALHQDTSEASSSLSMPAAMTVFERRVAPWLLDVVHLVQHDAWSLFEFVFATMNSHRPLLSPAMQQALLPPVVSRMLLLSRDSVCRVNGLHHLEHLIQFLPTTELCPDLLLLIGFAFFQTRGRVARFVRQVEAGRSDDELDVVLFLCRASKAYVRHLLTVRSEVQRRVKQRLLVDSKTSLGLVDELVVKEAVLLVTQMSCILDEQMMVSAPALYREGLRLVRTLVLALVENGRAAIETDVEQQGHRSIAATASVYTVAHVLYYGAVELREVALSVLLALCAPQVSDVAASSKLPLSWQSITQWWLPLVNPLVGVKEERIRVPASQVAILLVGALKLMTPPPPPPSSSSPLGVVSPLSYPSHLACIGAFERFLASRPSNADLPLSDGVPSSVGLQHQFQTQFATHLHKPLLLPMYVELRREVTGSTNSGVDEATGAVLALRSKESALQALSDAVSPSNCGGGLGPLKYVTSSDLAFGGDSAVLPQPHI